MPPAADPEPSPWTPTVRGRLLAAAADRLPLGLRTARVAPTARAAAALALVCLLTVLATAVVLLRSRPHQIRAPLPLSASRSSSQPAHAPSVTATADPSVGPGPAGSGSPPASPNQLLVVDVVGPVRRPGVVRLPPGSRVIDALAAAGGLKPGSGSGMLNLASVVTDGQQVVIGGPAAPTAAPDASGALGGAGATGSASASAVIDLNTATVQQLDELPGVGPVLAQRIVDWRSTNGRFSSVEQLAEVVGIGDRKLADLRKRVRV